MKRNVYCFLMMIIFSAAGIYAVPAVNIPAGTIYINELMAVNVLALGTAEGEYEDWIEIYNATDNAVNLAGCYFTDDLTQLQNAVLPSGQPAKTIIPAKGYRIFYADEKPGNGADHLSFKLNRHGDHIYLINPDGTTVIDSISFGEQLRDISYGRSPDNINQWGYLSHHSAGASNDIVYPDFVKPLIIEQEPGIYSSSITVSVKPIRAGEEIRYTLDGSIPSDTSLLYGGPVTINGSSVFSVRGFKNGYLPGETAVKSFLINVHHTLPVISLLTDPKNLYDPATGIYVNDYDGRVWERFCTVEYFKNDKNEFHIPAGLRIQGNSGPGDYDKKSFRVFLRDDYGIELLNYPLYPGNNIAKFSRLVLRSGYDDNIGPDRNGNKTSGTLVRDPLVTELWKQSGGLTSHSSFAVLYLNNLYHGIYDIKESIDENFINSYTGKENIDIIRTRWDSTEVTAGDKTEWNRMVSFFKNNSFEDDSRITEAEQFLDLDNYTDIYALALAAGYKNWAYGISLYRERSAGAVWKSVIWDADRSYVELSWNPLTDPYSATGIYLNIIITSKILVNNNFRNRFVNRISDLMNSVFTTNNVNNIIDSLSNTIAGEISADANKWGSSVEEWTANVSAVKSYASLRPAIVRQQIKDYFGLSGEYEITLDVSEGGKIRINSIVPGVYPWSGIYYAGIPVKLTAIEEPGYRFTGWSNPELPASLSVIVELTENMTVTANFVKLGESNVEVIVPARIKTGGQLPFVLRLHDDKWNINAIDQTPVQLNFGDAHADTSVNIKRGAGAGLALINTGANFILTAENENLSPVQKQVVVSDLPLIEYSGTLPPGDIIWDNSADRLIISDIIIPSGSRLIIKPGTWIYFKKYVNIYVQGSIIAEGTSNEPVIFTSENPAEPWGGMEFTNSASTFKYCFVVNGGGDASKGHPTNEDWHTGRQHIFFGKENSDFNFDNCFFLFSPGKVFGMQDSKISITNSVTSFVWHGGEFHRTLLYYQGSHLMNLPNDDHIYLEDIDTDGMHIDYVNSNYPEYSVIDSCCFVTGKDDAIDHHGARLKITNCWLEDFVHEGVAASGRDTIIIFNTVALKNDQAFEAGWSDSGLEDQPHLIIDHCVAIDNNVGLRIGDSYNWTYNSYMKVTNTILYNNKDNIWNYLNSTHAPLEGAIDISYSMTNDEDYNLSYRCLTGAPDFDAKYYLAASSAGAGLGTNGTNMGRADSASLLKSTVVINEIMYKAPDDMDTKDWIELYNPQKFEVDLTGWLLKDNDDSHSFLIPGGTVILPGEFIVLCSDTTDFKKYHTGVRNYKGNFPFGLGNDDAVRLYSPALELVDIVVYTNNNPWPAEADGKGYTLELTNPVSDNADAQNWVSSGVYGGTPGEINTITGVEKEKDIYPAEFSLEQNYPNPFNPVTSIEYSIPEQAHVQIVIYDILGRTINILVDEEKIPGKYKVIFNAQGLASGIYFAELLSGDKQMVKKLILLK